MALQPLVGRCQVKDYRQRNRLFISDATCIVSLKPDRRREVDLRFCVSVDVNLGWNARIAGIAPVGFPAGLQLDLQGTAPFPRAALSGFCLR